MNARGALALVALIAPLACQPVAAEELSFAEVERGRYLATAANCYGCHTDVERGGAPWSGGRELHTPFGVIVTPNVTFHDSGIGDWTRDDFWNALHSGVRADGARLYPAMPYPYFTRMPRADVDAIYTFLRTVAPVDASHQPEAGLPPPLRLRFAIRFWNALNFDEGVFTVDAEQSDVWNRGAYLVEGPAHCGACHTPKTLLGGDRRDEALRGGVLEDWRASNIRGGPGGGLAHWSQDEIAAYLGDGRNAHTGAMIRMGEVVALSMQHLQPEDRQAIAVYLKSLGDTRAEAGAPVEAAVERAGAAIYLDNCAACHRSDGAGVPGMFAALNASNKVRDPDPMTIIRIVLVGAQAVATDARPGPLGMPAYGWKLDDAQIAAVLSHVRGRWGEGSGVVGAADVARMRSRLD